MYLSQLRLYALDPRTTKLLGNRYRLHAAIMRGYSEASSEDRVLFRVEPLLGRSAWQDILVQAQSAPNWEDLLNDYGSACQINTKTFLFNAVSGKRYRFRLLANPTINRNRKRYGLVGEVARREWLERRAAPCGLRLLDYTVIDDGLLPIWKRDDGHEKKRDTRLTIHTARYEGRLEISDPKAFEQTLKKGIGAAKGFGCGLLSLAELAYAM